MARYRDPWSKKSKGGMKILTGMAKATYKVGKAAAKSKRRKPVSTPNKGCLMTLTFVAIIISAMWLLIF